MRRKFKIRKGSNISKTSEEGTAQIRTPKFKEDALKGRRSSESEEAKRQKKDDGEASKLINNDKGKGGIRDQKEINAEPTLRGTQKYIGQGKSARNSIKRSNSKTQEFASKRFNFKEQKDVQNEKITRSNVGSQEKEHEDVKKNQKSENGSISSKVKEAERLRRQAELRRLRRSKETPEQKEARRRRDLERKRLRRSLETDKEREERLRKRAARERELRKMRKQPMLGGTLAEQVNMFDHLVPQSVVNVPRSDPWCHLEIRMTDSRIIKVPDHLANFIWPYFMIDFWNHFKPEKEP